MKNKKNGFTLVEVILTIALIGIVTPIIYSLLFSGQKSFKLGTEEVYEQQDHRLLRNQLAKELRFATYLSNDKPKRDSDDNKYKKYYSIELEDEKIIKKEYKKSDDLPTSNGQILSSFKGGEIDFDFRWDFLFVEYKDEEDKIIEEFTILLENSKLKKEYLNLEDSKINEQEKIYYAMFQDREEINSIKGEIK